MVAKKLEVMDLTSSVRALASCTVFVCFSYATHADFIAIPLEIVAVFNVAIDRGGDFIIGTAFDRKKKNACQD
jgi:hypothetical protein